MKCTSIDDEKHCIKTLINLKQVENMSVGKSGTRYGDIIHTSDAGETCTSQVSGSSAFLFSVFFTDAATEYVTGSDGTILKTTNGGFSVGIKEKKQTNSLQINPNPAKEKITIGSSASGTNLNGLVSVCGSAGQQLISQQVQGTVVDINVSSLQAGIYFVKLTLEEKTE